MYGTRTESWCCLQQFQQNQKHVVQWYFALLARLEICVGKIVMILIKNTISVTCDDALPRAELCIGRRENGTFCAPHVMIGSTFSLWKFSQKLWEYACRTFQQVWEG